MGTLYHLLTGRALCQAAILTDTLDQVLHTDSPIAWLMRLVNALMTFVLLAAKA